MITLNKQLIEKYTPFIEQLSNKYKYDNNIKHLLYLIIPAFILKYKYKEQLILDTFNNTPIIISNKISETISAYYTSIPKYENENIITKKYIIINNYEKISLVNLLDNLVHEFNHAINSYKKETIIKDNLLYPHS